MYDAQDIAERLERRFALGQRPVIRRALYRRLGEICEKEGQRAYFVLQEVAEYAQTRAKGDKGNCFAFVVMRRLIERGIVEMQPL